MTGPEAVLLGGAVGAGGVLLGSIISGLVSYIVQKRKAKDDHKAWLRATLYEDSARLITTAFAYASASGPEDRPPLAELVGATSRVQAGSRTLAPAAQDLATQAVVNVQERKGDGDAKREERIEEFYRKWLVFLEAVRDELEVPDSGTGTSLSRSFLDAIRVAATGI